MDAVDQGIELEDYTMDIAIVLSDDSTVCRVKTRDASHIIFSATNKLYLSISGVGWLVVHDHARMGCEYYEW